MSLRRQRILWVDDEPSPYSLKFELEMNGLSVDISYASTVASAKRKLAGNRFDIVILDWLVPNDSEQTYEEGGEVLLRYIDAAYRNKANRPAIIFFSAAADNGFDFAAMLAEATEVPNFLAFGKLDESSFNKGVVAILRQRLNL